MIRRRRLPPLRHLVAALGLAIVAAVGVAVSRNDGAAPVAPVAAVAVAPTPVGEPQRVAPRPPLSTRVEPAVAVRAVGGPAVTPPRPDVPLQRVDLPPKPLPPPPPIVPRRLMPVAMEDTATLSMGEIRVRLPGVAIISPDEICRDAAGVDWPCGRRALAGVRAVVRGHTIECPLPDKVKRGSFDVDCRIAGADLAERLVASGWARALDRESGLGEIERRAAERGLGLHARAAPDLVDRLPEPPAPPIDITTAPIDPDAARAPMSLRP